MAGFHGGFSLLLFVSFLFPFFLGSTTTSGAVTHEDEYSHHDLSLGFTRDELVQEAGYGEEKLSSVLVAGTVVCDACPDGEDELRPWPVEGALVGITCKNRRENTRKVSSYNMNEAKGTTDEYGDFLIHLPSHLHANPNLEQTCTARVLHLPKHSPCRRRAISRRRKAITFSSAGNGIRAYTTGTISFRQRSRPGRHVCLGRKGKEGQEEGRVW
ncbi:hypothetical protein H6P81_014897 [Aristolochia fimbriata]|uniref:Pollen Ole e 1 allergen and extensin family protein n=1 Tax=Aristolochia fimbriata TaxID=158543 RepID=A0AAV7E3Z3_ARIFI|nr:hypothetical protein H6P81_014897 [Aristolochia fimbriata]